MSIALVDAVTGNGDSSTSTIAAGSQDTTVDNLLVAIVYWTHASAVVNNLTDTAFNTWLQFPSSKIDTGSDNIEIWYCNVDAADAANVVTAQFSVASTFRRIVVMQFSGAEAVSSPIDSTAVGTGSGSSATATTASFTTAQAEEVICTGVSGDTATGHGAGAAGVEVVDNLGLDSAAEYQILSSIGTYTGSMTIDAGTIGWWITAAAFKGPVASVTPAINPDYSRFPKL
jgi:hypothetical protein